MKKYETKNFVMCTVVSKQITWAEINLEQYKNMFLVTVGDRRNICCCSEKKNNNKLKKIQHDLNRLPNSIVITKRLNNSRVTDCSSLEYKRRHHPHLQKTVARCTIADFTP